MHIHEDILEMLKIKIKLKPCIISPLEIITKRLLIGVFCVYIACSVFFSELKFISHIIQYPLQCEFQQYVILHYRENTHSSCT